MGKKVSAEATVKDIRRQTRRQHNAEEKIRIVLEGLRGEETIAELCSREGIGQSLYYKWSKEFLEAGKSRLAGDTKRQASSDAVDELVADRFHPVQGGGLGLLLSLHRAGRLFTLHPRLALGRDYGQHR